MSSLSSRLRRSATLRTLLGPVLAARRRLADPGHPYALRTWERLQELVVDDLVIGVPEFGGTFQIDVRSHLFSRLLIDGAYEPELASLCRRLVDPARDALDVGANVGFFTVLLAAQLPGRRVLAAEPSPAVVPRLRANLERNGVASRVVVFEGAVSDQSGRVALHGVEGNEEYGTIGQPAHPGLWGGETPPPVQTVSVEARPLDALVADHDLSPGFVKVDAEGAEHLVFGGAAETLATHRPVVLTELDDRLLRTNGSSAMAVVEVFHRHRYRVVDPLDPAHAEVTRERLEAGPALDEILCLPDDRSLA